MMNQRQLFFFLHAVFFAASLPLYAGEPNQDIISSVANPEALKTDYKAENARAEIKRSPLPQGVIPARPLKIPRNEKVRISEPKIYNIVRPAGQVQPLVVPALNSETAAAVLPISRDAK